MFNNLFFNPHKTFWGRSYYPHFIHEAMKIQGHRAIKWQNLNLTQTQNCDKEKGVNVQRKNKMR